MPHSTPHPFGELLRQHCQRKPGLTQNRLAGLAGIHPSVIARMCVGAKDLTGPSGRDRVLRLIDTLAEQGALATIGEADSLLAAASMPPLFAGQRAEAQTILRLSGRRASHKVRRTNLPAQVSSFVGRAAEVAEIRALLGHTRMLTLTGAGGCGKTRLAQRVAADALLDYPEGVWYAELAAVTDAQALPAMLIAALGLTLETNQALKDLLDFIGDRTMLLVLDNCEHLLQPLALTCETILHACPHVTILATSREKLTIDGEMAWRVPPMLQAEAARLFSERATVARGGRQFNDSHGAVGAICVRLDGMPLAIEIAAARLNALSLDEIAIRLNDRFDFLVNKQRGALPRHQTLRALIDWSHDALSEKERALFRRLGVFAGGWDIGLVEELLVDQDTSAAASVQMLTTLVEKSLVQVDHGSAQTRFRFLETIREYAIAMLELHGEAEVYKRKHAQVVFKLVSDTAPLLQNSHQSEALRTLRDEFPNIQAALEWTIERASDPALGCSIVSKLFHFWYTDAATHMSAEKWSRLAVERMPPDCPVDIHAWILLCQDCFCAGNERVERCEQIYRLFVEAHDPVRAALAKSVVARAYFYEKLDYPTALRLSEEAVAEARKLKAGWELRFNLTMLGECLRFAHHDPARAELAYREALELSRLAGDTVQVSMLQGYYVSLFALEQLNFEAALLETRAAITLAEQADDTGTRVFLLCQAADAHICLGDCDHARAKVASALEIVAERLPARFNRAPSLVAARIALQTHDLLLARDILAGLLEPYRPMAQNGSFPWGAHHVVDCLSAVAGAGQQAAACATLRAIADNLFRGNHHYRPGHLTWLYAASVENSKAALGEDGYSEAYRSGNAMDTAEAMSYALSAVAQLQFDAKQLT
jgi:predicted ATPase